MSLDINPASRQALEQLIREGGLARLIEAGARLHQTGCNGCLGMGQAPAAGRRSLRTVTRNFPGRSGTKEDQVYLCSPETAAASALSGVITDPRRLAMPYPRIEDSGGASAYDGLIEAPLPPGDRPRALVKGPYHASLPDFEPIGDELALPVLLKLGDNVSTDEIVPGGVIGLSLWSSLPGMTSLAFKPIDESYVDRARLSRRRPRHHPYRFSLSRSEVMRTHLLVKGHNMQVPLDITFRNSEPSEAIRAEVEKQAKRLEKFHDRITSCHVTVIAPTMKRRHGDLFKIDICVAMPQHKDILVSKAHGDAPEHEHVMVAIKDAFAAAQRQIEDAAREMRG